MLYTRKGDDGTTKFFDSKSGERASKRTLRAEALGTLDEINSLIGVVKTKAEEKNFTLAGKGSVSNILETLQHLLFTAQAELAGAEKTIPESRVKYAEEIIDVAEAEMPPITSFFVSGGTELAALLDFSRTVARRAERRVIAAAEAEEIKIGVHTRQFLNRLSSVLYALARYANFNAGISEEKPRYE